jgi:hypothetical protein
MKAKGNPSYKSIKITVAGVRYAGSYSIEKGMITVSGADQQESTQVGAYPEIQAKMILRKLVERRPA